MKYTYAYKTSDGQRHEAAMEADSREAVFARLRTQGIKAIKVVAADGSKANGAQGVSPAAHRVKVLALCGACLILGAIVAGIVALRTGGDRASASPSADVRATRLAQPLPRQMIPGDRQRIEQAIAALTNAAERTLAAFAEPGRSWTAAARTADEKPSEAEFAATLAMPLRIAADELTESIDVKRIVAGMKQEMRRYLAGGGTVSGYLAECAKRQKQEIAYRARAEERLEKALKAASSQTALAAAYAYWLKANAQLQSMGIYPLPLPDPLRDYQLSLDIEE